MKLKQKITRLSQLRIFILLIFSQILFSQLAGQQTIFPDTTKVKQLLQKGENLHLANPDSAIYYYRIIVNDFQKNGVSFNYSNPSNSETVYLKTILKAINHIGDTYYYDDQYIRSETYYRQSLNLARQAKLEAFVAKALFDIGYIKYVNHNYSESRVLFEQAYIIYDSLTLQNKMYRAINACGLSEYHLGNFRAADSCFHSALTLALAMNDSLLISDIKIHLGILYCEQEKLEEGINLFNQAMDYYEKTGNTEAISDAALDIGVVMKIAGEYDKALKYINKSTNIEELSQVKSQLVSRYYNLADLYLDLNNKEKAYSYCQKTLAVANEIASKPFVADCNFLMGKYYMLEKNYNDAIFHFSNALTTAQENKNKILIATIYLWYAKVYIKLNNLEQSASYADKAYNISNQLNISSLQKEASYLLFLSYNKGGNAKKALNWFEVYHNLSDSINYYKQQKEIRKIEARYNYEKKERENELLLNKASLQAVKLKNRTITMMVLLLGIILSIVVIILLISRIKYSRALNREQQLLSLNKLQNLNKELESKKRELASKMIFLNQKNELLERIINHLKELQKTEDIPHKEINALVNELRTDAPQSNWKEFEIQFVQVHPDFYKRLYQKFPDLTSYEQRICAFLRMNLNTKEIASITGRSAKSIEVTRSRIRKKLSLSRKDNLSSFLASI